MCRIEHEIALAFCWTVLRRDEQIDVHF
jgi:hypothetical protein